ncbi:hypothetical protein E1286_23145 [Nonomuraea terrae]|uniref:Uncharacterized protein n=1 Tax=Nonomuraea terrae TaxID=2530383 RepID=A0A4R4YNK1_9ACTN|nr:hypothetical protein [Nonomuraea terrae]TDD45709.1 hypothetical protein E1286_23145 [Nonomuraea terrae]
MILGVDTGTRTLAAAEHLLHTVVRALGLPGDAVGCTHLVPAGLGMPEPHLACSLEVPGGPVKPPAEVSWALGGERVGPLAEGAALAAAEHGRSGRVVTFPGRDRLTGTLTVGELRGGSAIDRVLVLATPDPPADDALVVTNDHVRPIWRDGLMTLLTMPAAGGRLAPAEVPNPTPCCADHA